MPESEKVRLLILVKAAPVIVHDVEEAICVAAMTLNGPPEWIRLFPIPFRDLDGDQRFAKYQEVTLRVIPARGDVRPESRTPIQGSITLGRKIPPGPDWYERRSLVQQLGEYSMCNLNRMQHEQGVRDAPSLGVIRIAGKPDLSIEPLEEEKRSRWQARADAAVAQQSLFDDPMQQQVALEVPDWKFKYRYTCTHRNCSGHEQTIIDWEIAELWRNVRDQDDWRDKIRRRFVDDMWSPARDSRLFVGNQRAHPSAYLVLGVFWPPGVSTLF